jgi:tungstate transport system permease protein
MLEAFGQAIRLMLNADPTVLEILGRSLQVTLSALCISTLIGIPFGAWFALVQFRGKQLITALIYTGMALPPVVVGLTLYLMFSRSGPLGAWGWLFSMSAMISAQTLLALPLIVGLTVSSIQAVDPALRVQLRALGASPRQATWAQLVEARRGVILGVVAGFGSIISEVGAVMLVGGNIEGRTRVLTTAIVLETQRGNFDLALALGIILLTLCFAANFVIVIAQGRAR